MNRRWRMARQNRIGSVLELKELMRRLTLIVLKNKKGVGMKPVAVMVGVLLGMAGVVLAETISGIEPPKPPKSQSEHDQSVYWRFKSLHAALERMALLLRTLKDSQKLSPAEVDKQIQTFQLSSNYDAETVKVLVEGLAEFRDLDAVGRDKMIKRTQAILDAFKIRYSNDYTEALKANDDK